MADGLFIVNCAIVGLNPVQSIYCTEYGKYKIKDVTVTNNSTAILESDPMQKMNKQILHNLESSTSAYITQQKNSHTNESTGSDWYLTSSTTISCPGNLYHGVSWLTILGDRIVPPPHNMDKAQD
jgi:hypothetical protein